MITHEGRLCIFTIHKNTAPGGATVTTDVIHPGRTERLPKVVICPSLEEARRYIRDLGPGLARLDRDPSDDPSIIESWL